VEAKTLDTTRVGMWFSYPIYRKRAIVEKEEVALPLVRLLLTKEVLWYCYGGISSIIMQKAENNPINNSKQQM
jgi:hypothetical protein